MGLEASSIETAPQLNQDGSPPSRSTSRSFAKLPAQTEVVDLVEKFFENTALLFPFIRKQRLLDIYDEFQNTKIVNANQTAVCILNMVIALAAVFSRSNNDTEQRFRKGDTFLQAALQALEGSKRQHATLETVQALLLASKYLQGTSVRAMHGEYIARCCRSPMRSDCIIRQHMSHGLSTTSIARELGGWRL